MSTSNEQEDLCWEIISSLQDVESEFISILHDVERKLEDLAILHSNARLNEKRESPG